mgnify:FL=1
MIRLKSQKNIDLINKLIEIIKKLRSPDGCDWDKQQTHKSLTPYLLEETYEVIEAIENENFTLLQEELGDLLLHVFFQIQIAEESNHFKLQDVVSGINKKLIDRHPHIFFDKNDPRWKKTNWELSKKKEKNRKSVLDGVPNGLPEIHKARRIQEKASSVGFDWNNLNQVISKVDEEIRELKESIKINKGINEEFGDVIFSLVNLSRHLSINPSESLNLSINKFVKRFQRIEKQLNNEKNNMNKLSIEELDEIWEKNKKKFE